MPSRMPNVLTENRDGVLVLTINRPDKYNAFDVPTIKELRATFEKLCHGQDVDAIVLTGAGKAFCAGGDVTAMRESLKNNPAKFLDQLIEQFHPLLLDIRQLPKPVVAAVNGSVAGGGFGLALACDARVAGTTVSFRPAYRQLGIVPDGGLTALLPRYVGWGVAQSVILQDRAIKHEEALRLGLVDEVVAPDGVLARAIEVAARMGNYPMESFKSMKELLNQSFLGEYAVQLDRERRRITEAAKGPWFVEGVNAFFEKREPQFRKRDRERKNLTTEA